MVTCCALLGNAFCFRRVSLSFFCPFYAAPPSLTTYAETLKDALPRSLIPPLRHKSSRMALRRTQSFLSLSDYSECGSFLHLSPSDPPSAPSNTRSVAYCREHRERFKPGGKSTPEFIIGSLPSPPKQPKKQCTQTSILSAPSASATRERKTSPLAPTRKVLPPRASFPRSKPKPDLYRTAIKKRMANSPDGEKILCMGPRPTVAILTTIRELEHIVSAARYDDDDIVMADDIPGPPSTATTGRLILHVSRVWCSDTSDAMTL